MHTKLKPLLSLPSLGEVFRLSGLIALAMSVSQAGIAAEQAGSGNDRLPVDPGRVQEVSSILISDAPDEDGAQTSSDEDDANTADAGLGQGILGSDGDLVSSDSPWAQVDTADQYVVGIGPNDLVGNTVLNSGPVDFADPASVGTYMNSAKGVWTAPAQGGLPGVVSVLEGYGYDFEDIWGNLIETPEYKFIDPHQGYPSGRIHPYTLTNLHIAIAAGLTGKGQLIAINDWGFHPDHPDLAGKEYSCYSPSMHWNPFSCSSGNGEYHGTAVSVIAGGSFDGDGALGVAWDAEFLFLDHVYPSIAFADLVSQIAYARDQEAVVINNSWGFKGNEFNDPLVAKASLAGIASAYESFQDVGVVVFARSNARQLGPDHPRSQYLSDLPDLFPELQDAWISAINAKFHESSVDGSLYMLERQSSACGKSAAWCLVGSGDAMAANSWGDYTNYLTGSSFVAPQISGAIALLAEAFPDLSPAEWTARLLASANNSWFADSGSTVVNEAGELLYDPSMLAERCWNNNAVCHTYSTEWGTRRHGHAGRLVTNWWLEPVDRRNNPVWRRDCAEQRHNRDLIVHDAGLGRCTGHAHCLV